MRLPGPVRRALDHPVLDPGKEVVEELVDDRVSGLAAEIAFFSILSVFPLLLLLTSSLGAMDSIVGADVSTEAEAAITDGLRTALGADADEVNRAVRQLFEEPSPGLFSVGLLLSLWAASRAFAGTANALDVVYDLEEKRPWIKVRLLGLGLTAGTVVVATLLLGLVLVGPLLGTGRDLADRFELGGAFVTAWSYLRGPFIALALVGWATTLYHLAPHHQTPWRADLPGAMLAALGWGLVTVGFRAYVSLASGNVVLGAIGGVLTTILWMYAMAFVLLAGAQVNAVLGQRAGRVSAPHPDDAASGPGRHRRPVRPVRPVRPDGVGGVGGVGAARLHPFDRLGRRLHGTTVDEIAAAEGRRVVEAAIEPGPGVADDRERVGEATPEDGHGVDVDAGRDDDPPPTRRDPAGGGVP